MQAVSMSLPPYFTPQEFAERLAMSETLVYEECRRFLRSKGREGIPCKKFGRAVRIPSEDAVAWEASR